MSGPVIVPFAHRWGNTDGPRVLLIHGATSYAGVWWRVGSRLAQLGCAVVAPDLRGHGRSAPAESYLFSEMAADLASLDGDWDLIVGHSLGGPIACLLATERPPRNGLLLLDPFLDAVDSEFDAIVEAVLTEVDPNATEESIAAQHPAWHPEDSNHKAIGARLTSRYAVERCLRDNAPYHHLGLLGDVNTPVSILGSDPALDALFHPEFLDRIDNTDVWYEMVHEAGHSLQRERPVVVVDRARVLLGL